MAATYDYGAYTANGKSLHLKWLEADMNEVTVRNVGAKTCGSSGYYGVNGTFFDMGTGDLTGIAINGGASVRYAGHMNQWNVSAGRGTLIKLNNNLPDGTFLFEKKVFQFDSNNNISHNGYTVNISNIKWAIGGISLYFGSTLTESQFNTLIGDETPPALTSNRPRTAIGYKGANKVVLCAIFDGSNLWDSTKGCTIWDVRTVMKDKFGCTMAINLDGGGSTQISFKQNGSNNYHQTEARNIYSMVTVPM
jgi:exopolysaccharide biosynthesis protein